MALKLSIFTTITDPERRGDNYRDAVSCYEDLADEVVVVDGSQPWSEFTSTTKVHHLWPQDFRWDFIGEQFTRGYEACTGDAVIHADLDFIFHEKDFEDIRAAAQRMLDNNLPAMSFYKYQFILPDRYNLKSRLVIMVNKRDYGDRIKFDSGGDLAQPSLDGKYINPDTVPESKIGFYNYEKLLKTKEQIAEDQGRMERAWFRQFGEYQMRSNGTDEAAYDKWVQAQVGKFNKPQQKIKLEDHSKYIQQTIKSLTPEMWGHSGHNYLERNSYAY